MEQIVCELQPATRRNEHRLGRKQVRQSQKLGFSLTETRPC